MPEPVVAGVDVGGERKGFHAAARRGCGIVSEPRQCPEATDVVEWVKEIRPTCIAVDSPAKGAPAGETRRRDEAAFAEEKICGIRWTPDEDVMRNRQRDRYYNWILRGFDLYGALNRLEIEVIECFPTATWSICFEPRHGRRRAAWSRDALASLGLSDMPSRRLNQDDRDALGAAYTAMLWTQSPRQARRVGDDLVIPDPSPATG